MYIYTNPKNPNRFEINLNSNQPTDNPDGYFTYDMDENKCYLYLNNDFDYYDDLRRTMVYAYGIDLKREDIVVNLTEDLMNREMEKFNETVRLKEEQQEKERQEAVEKERLEIVKRDEEISRLEKEREALENQRLAEEEEHKRRVEEENSRLHKQDLDELREELKALILQSKEVPAPTNDPEEFFKEDLQKEPAIEPPATVEETKGWLLLDEVYELPGDFEYTVQLRSIDEKFLDISFKDRLKLFFSIIRKSWVLIFKRL